jgi:hypothetical protein
LAGVLGGCPASDDGRSDDAADSGGLTNVDSGPTVTTTDDPTATTMAAGTAGIPTSTSGTDEAGGTDAIKFDLGLQPDAPIIDMGCRKVDFLFVIDNSGSMSAQQTQLLASYQGFIDAIQMSLQDSVDSYHVGVITSDAYTGNAPGCTGLGDLVTQTQATGNCAPFAEGGRFATEQDDLSVKFPCIAQVGVSGSGNELPISATVAALDPAQSLPGACNEGFLRDDAILVLVVLTDDPPYAGSPDDAHPMADTSGWYDAVINAKNGDPQAMVVIGFVPWTDVSCVIFNLESPNLINFVQAFGDQGVLASICEPDFGPVFAQTVSTIVSTCENFEPPG